MQTKTREIRLQGVPISHGICIGTPFFFTFDANNIPELNISLQDVEFEIKRYHAAVLKSMEDIKKVQNQLEQEHVVEGASILDAQLHILQDPMLVEAVETQIRTLLKNAEFVFQRVLKQYQKKFNTLADPFFRERFKDIQDISRRVMSHLMKTMRATLADLPKESIVFAKELTTSNTAEANFNAVAGFVSQEGGITSHAAIVARARGIPYVSSVNFEALESFKDSIVIVDGRTGEVIVDPDSNTLTAYSHLRAEGQEQYAQLDKISSYPTETFDGYPVRLSANIEMAKEVEILHQYGAHGVGLFRSEYVFLASEQFPSEEEQFEVYHQFVQQMQGLPIVIRTFDVGADKFVSHAPIKKEANPFLGCRAIRYLLAEKEIFSAQIKAILRAGAFGDVSIMFPMISSLHELREAKALVHQAQAELKSRGVEISERIRVGCMIEVPSAATIADLLAKECDFLSIGTNDLVQYALAVDRDNQAMSRLYAPTHPSVLRMIRQIVNDANHCAIPVTVCGEIAADPRFTPLLLGLGVHELSVASRYLPIIKNVIRQTSIIEAYRLTEKALTLSTAQEVEELLDLTYQHNLTV